MTDGLSEGSGESVGSGESEGSVEGVALGVSVGVGVAVAPITRCTNFTFEAGECVARTRAGTANADPTAITVVSAKAHAPTAIFVDRLAPPNLLPIIFLVLR
jgi:hypothetical protein